LHPTFFLIVCLQFFNFYSKWLETVQKLLQLNPGISFWKKERERKSLPHEVETWKSPKSHWPKFTQEPNNPKGGHPRLLKKWLLPRFWITVAQTNNLCEKAWLWFSPHHTLNSLLDFSRWNQRKFITQISFVFYTTEFNKRNFGSFLLLRKVFTQNSQ